MILTNDNSNSVSHDQAVCGGAGSKKERGNSKASARALSLSYNQTQPLYLTL